MGLSQTKIVKQVIISVMKMIMDTVKWQTTDMTYMLEVNTKMLEQSVETLVEVFIVNLTILNKTYISKFPCI